MPYTFRYKVYVTVYSCPDAQRRYDGPAHMARSPELSSPDVFFKLLITIEPLVGRNPTHASNIVYYVFGNSCSFYNIQLIACIL